MHRQMTGQELRKAVVERAEQYGWRVMTFGSEQTDAGWPDIFAIRDREALALWLERPGSDWTAEIDNLIVFDCFTKLREGDLTPDIRLDSALRHGHWGKPPDED